AARLHPVRLGAGNHGAGGVRARDPAPDHAPGTGVDDALLAQDAGAGAEAAEDPRTVQRRPQAHAAGDDPADARGEGVVRGDAGLPADVPAVADLDRAVRDALLLV